MWLLLLHCIFQQRKRILRDVKVVIANIYWRLCEAWFPPVIHLILHQPCKVGYIIIIPYCIDEKKSISE